MHQLFQDMGRQIIRQESPKGPGGRSRLWCAKDSFNGTKTIEGLVLNLHMKKAERPERHENDTQSTLPYGGNPSKRRCLGLLSLLPINSAAVESSSEPTAEAEFKTDAFSHMHKLRILQLNHVHLTGDYQEFPKKLRWLSWRGFTSKSIPDNFPLERLVVLDLRNSSLMRLLKGTKVLRVLKILNLSHSHSFKISPNFSQLPSLEKLILKDCINLVEVHKSIGGLHRRALSNLTGCKNIRNLPREICQLNSLEKLILSGCSKINNLPAELGNMESLREFCADGVNLLPSVSTPRKSAEFSLALLPRFLVKLSLAECNVSDNAFPKDLSTGPFLEDLNLSRNPICGLPETIKDLSSLKFLYLEHCTKLRLLPELPGSLSNCRSLEVAINLANLLRSLLLTIVGCDRLSLVQDLFRLDPIEKMDSQMIKHLGMAQAEAFGGIEVELFNNLTYTSKKTSVLQGLYECGICSSFLPGNEVPA